MADLVKNILAKPIQLADQIIKAADEAASFKQECSEIKAKTSKLVDLLRQAARSSSGLYERPTRRIVEDTEQILEKVLTLVLKCRTNGLLKRAFNIIPAGAFRKMSSSLGNSIGDVSWLLRVSAPADSRDADSDYLGLPPIAANEPILCLIWEQIAILFTGTLDDRGDAAASLVSLARDNDRYGKLIIEEGGVGPLLRLVKDGKTEGQENAAKAIGLLGRDPESVEHMVHNGVCSVFGKVLKEGQMRVQARVAWAISKLAAHYPKCQDLFAQHSVVRLLVGHLAFETIQEHSKYAIATFKAASMHQAVVMASNNTKGGFGNIAGAIVNGGNTNNNSKVVVVDDEEEETTPILHPTGRRSDSPNRLHSVVTSTLAMKAQQTPQGNVSTAQSNNLEAGLGNGNGNLKPSTNLMSKNSHYSHNHSQHSIVGIKVRELEDPEVKADMKAMAARALWYLAKGNSNICRSITESRALLCFAVLLEKGTEEIQYNSAMAVMEITAVAEKDADLRRSAFKPNSPACKAVVEQLLKIIERANSDLLVPCVTAIGNLARTFRATETRMIGPLVLLLDEREPEVTREAAIALSKFACVENYLHMDHSKAIISAGGIKHLVQLVYFGEQMVQVPACVLLSYIALHVPDSNELEKNEVLNVLDWASKQAHLIQDDAREKLLIDSKARLELYQSRGTRLSSQNLKG